MKTKLLLVILASIVMSMLAAVPVVPEGYTVKDGNEDKIVLADDFTGALKGWNETIPGTFALTAGAGPNGRACLVVNRENPDTHPMLTREFKGIPGKRYLVKMLLKADNLRTPSSLKKGKGAVVTIHPLFFDHFNEDGSYYSGNYSSLKVACSKTTGWYEINYEFNYPKGAAKSLFSIGGYIPTHAEKLQGTLYYSGLEIHQQGDLPLLVYPVHPTQLLLDESGRIVVHVHDFMKRPDNTLSIRAICGDRESTAPVINDESSLVLGKLPYGRHEVSFQVLDTAKKEVIGTNIYYFTVPMPGDDQFEGSARVNDNGILLVDGKPFMTRFTCVAPQKLDEQIVQGIKDAGYNALLAYSSPTMTLNAGDAKPRTIECIKRGLDYLHAHGMKIIFCVKEQVQDGIMEFDGIKGRFELVEHIVRHFKRHPAILCWYISDENPLNEIPKVIELRHRISAIDPFHPVLTCTDNFANQYHFAMTGDIMNPDSYPIFNDKSQSMSKIRNHMTRNTGLPVWFAAQGFNWGAFINNDLKNHRYPTEEEMRSMGLLAMNLGIRGISYYSYTSVFIRQEKLAPGSSKWFWPRVVNVIQLLKELEPFFYTTEAAPAVEIVNRTGKAQTEAKAYKAGDRICVVVTGDGPDDVSLTFRVPGVKNLKSRFGHITANADGSFTFTGTNICSDILVNW